MRSSVDLELLNPFRYQNKLRSHSNMNLMMYDGAGAACQVHSREQLVGTFRFRFQGLLNLS